MKAACVQDGSTALHLAGREGHTSTLELLLQKGASANVGALLLVSDILLTSMLMYIKFLHVAYVIPAVPKDAHQYKHGWHFGPKLNWCIQLSFEKDFVMMGSSSADTLVLTFQSQQPSNIMIKHLNTCAKLANKYVCCCCAHTCTAMVHILTKHMCMCTLSKMDKRRPREAALLGIMLENSATRSSPHGTHMLQQPGLQLPVL